MVKSLNLKYCSESLDGSPTSDNKDACKNGAVQSQEGGANMGAGL